MKNKYLQKTELNLKDLEEMTKYFKSKGKLEQRETIEMILQFINKQNETLSNLFLAIYKIDKEIKE